MKRCPKCNREVSEHAKQCPYCGEKLIKQYQPISHSNKRPSRKSGVGYVIVMIAMIITPVILSFFLTSTSGNAYTPSEEVTLGKVEIVSKDKEKVIYIFDSLDEFQDKVKEAKKYTKMISHFEDKVKDVVSKYHKSSFDPTYQIYVTKSNNIFFYLTYDMTIENKETITIDLEYDVTGRTNEANISYSINDLKDFEELKIKENSYPMFKDILAIINGKKEQSLFIKTGESFNELESEFKNREGRIGNYGLGTSGESKNESCSIRALAKGDKYRLKVRVDTKIQEDILF